jgi:hypothetical protein
LRLLKFLLEGKQVPKIKDKDIIEYQDKFGLGPCLPIAVVLREKGYGDIYFGQYGPKDDWTVSFPHFWIKTKGGKIIDPSNPFPNKKDYTYWDVEKITASEKNPEPGAYGEDDIEFWRNKLK